MNNQVSSTLDEALRRLDLSLPEAQVRSLEAYCRALWDWNERLNLTRHTTYDLFAARDVVDALQLSAVLEKGEEILDVGSGGGPPGALLAILRDDLDVSLCESIAKKAKALDEIVKAAKLQVPVHHARAESLLEDFRYDSLTARAIGPLWKLCKWFEPYWQSMNRLVLIKGPKWIEERADARHRGAMHGLELRKLASYQPAGMDGQCVVLQLKRGTASPAMDLDRDDSD